MKNSCLNPCFFIFGFGYTAEALAKELLQLNYQVIGTTRDKKKILSHTSADYMLIDFHDPGIARLLSRATHLLISVPPLAEIGDPVLASYSDLIRQHASHIQWLGYLSSTSVYGDHQGAWVTEESAFLAPGIQGRLRVQAENAWMAFAKAQKIPLHVFRLAGIYGPKRNAIERLIAGKKESIFKEGHFFSRAHVADIVSVICGSIKKPHPYSVYNVADDEPAPAYCLDAFAASLLNRSPLPLVPYTAATLSPMEQQFYANNRRVSNEKIKKELGITLLYPSYREGLSTIFKEMQHRIK
ncbi:SDR family oxidoreductase [Fluoribacter dumoffii]|uniref:NAD dependent epimerase/dehydratase family n=1 Tax=Fluoribacter dumoffii TaxID=463 RepID=A0A377GE86_9GAMM|nr:SDR family oxidoreductase [Fluoribacter dumoffii]KTC91115.1 NAD-dependent epimerase/dehydratase [Fluoribacter dumoffii NY 23]MCW8416724.1 SDR family oxidoreductase [Fluoribacter dumoffii]MCW8455436.1 SDR family oxidoreductase [Fluoribacter dumoffii]MCW8460486.1 SDR family oxidoreductase [Fluoribacter dumoffii]MCW8483967.1 SDR family oxidoreductase [Fluoribacter dumoffii]